MGCGARGVCPCYPPYRHLTTAGDVKWACSRWHLLESRSTGIATTRIPTAPGRARLRLGPARSGADPHLKGREHVLAAIQPPIQHDLSHRCWPRQSNRQPWFGPMGLGHAETPASLALIVQHVVCAVVCTEQVALEFENRTHRGTDCVDCSRWDGWRRARKGREWWGEAGEGRCWRWCRGREWGLWR